MSAAEDLTPPTSRSGYGASVREPTPPVYVDSENTPEQFQAIVSPAPLSRGRFLFEHMNTVVRRLTAKQMPVEPRMVLTVMVDHANAEGIAWPAVETVADMAGVSEGTARKAIRQLVDNGWLTALNGTKGGRETIHYRVNLNGRPLSVAADPRPRQGYTASTPGVHAEHPRGSRGDAQGFTPSTPGVHAAMPRGAPREPDPHSDPLRDPHNETHTRNASVVSDPNPVEPAPVAPPPPVPALPVLAPAVPTAKRSRKKPEALALPGVGADVADDVFAAYLVAWRRKIGKGTEPVLDKARRTLVHRRIAEGHTAPRLKAAVAGIFESDWHYENRADGRCSIELALRDAGQIEKFGALADAAAPVAPIVRPAWLDDLPPRPRGQLRMVAALAAEEAAADSDPLAGLETSFVAAEVP